MLFATTFLGIRNAYSTYSVPGVIKALVSGNYKPKLQCWYTGTVYLSHGVGLIFDADFFDLRIAPR